MERERLKNKLSEELTKLRTLTNVNALVEIHQIVREAQKYVTAWTELRHMLVTERDDFNAEKDYRRAEMRDLMLATMSLIEKEVEL